MRLGTLEHGHRERLRQILDATAVFRPDEVSVALDLFDEPSGEDYEFLGAFEGDDLVGYACFGPTPGTDRTYDLYWIAMHPRAQGHGGGSHLLNAVEDRLRSRDARLLVAETSSRSEYNGTRAFYAARGYREVACMRDFYAPNDDRMIYTKHLVPQSLVPSPAAQ